MRVVGNRVSMGLFLLLALSLVFSLAFKAAWLIPFSASIVVLVLLVVCVKEGYSVVVSEFRSAHFLNAWAAVSVYAASVAVLVVSAIGLNQFLFGPPAARRVADRGAVILASIGVALFMLMLTFVRAGIAAMSKNISGKRYTIATINFLVLFLGFVALIYLQFQVLKAATSLDKGLP